MNRLFLSFIVLQLFVAVSCWSAQSADKASDMDYYLKNTRIFSGDAFGGRAPLSAYEEKSIQFIADEFRRLGLKPGCSDGSYFQPVELNTVSALDKKPMQGTTHNVVALLPGESDEYVMVCAHWDHLGTGAPVDGDSIYNGAADNAVGVVIMMNIARRMAQSGQTPKRGIIFMATTAEEEGLLGSAWYCQHPVFPLEKTIAAVNIDGGGPLGKARNVEVYAAGLSSLDQVVEQLAKAEGRYASLFTQENDKRGIYRRTDSWSFIQAGVPSVFVCGGQDFVNPEEHASHPRQQNHHPKDEFREDWDLSGVEDQMNFLLKYVQTLSDLEERPALHLPFMNADLPVAQRVEDLLSRLTAAEKVGLMMNNSAAVPRLGVPAYEWWNEALHGVARSGMATVFPQAIGMAAAFDPDAQFKTFSIVSDEARAKYNEALRQDNRRRYYGITFWTPNINIFRDPRWGRGMETYGEDPYLSATLGVQTVKGLQGDNEYYFKTHACAKHFAVHSGPEWSRHSYDAYVSDRDLWETYLPVFEALVKKGNVQEVMCAYNRFEGEPCCGSDKLLIQILRDKWNYQGLVVSDCGAIDDFYRQGHHETHADAVEASADAVLTGTDIECGSSYRALIQAVEQGKIKESELDVSVRRLLKGRFELGMFDPDEKVPWSEYPYEMVGSDAHAAHALEMARKSMTLLKNAGNVLPLSENIRTLAVVGPNAADSTMMWGNYNGTPKKTVTILQGLQQRLPRTNIMYERGCEWVGEIENSALQALSEKVRPADAIIYVGGLNPRLEGEEMRVNAEGFRGGDRDSIDLPTVQKQVLAALRATGKPVIFVLCSGSAIAMGDIEKQYDALLEAWYPGQAGGTAVAEVLLGDYNPAGRLPITFYASQKQIPEDFENYSMEGRTYRYMKDKPLYAFGYGLSYTTFKYGKASLSSKSIKAGDAVDVTLQVKNAGKRDGDEVVQVYVQRLNDPEAPVKALKGFVRQSIAAGATAQVTLTLEPDAFAYYDYHAGENVVKPGDYRILYGGSSRDEDLKALKLTVE